MISEHNRSTYFRLRAPTRLLWCRAKQVVLTLRHKGISPFTLMISLCRSESSGTPGNSQVWWQREPTNMTRHPKIRQLLRKLLERTDGHEHQHIHTKLHARDGIKVP